MRRQRKQRAIIPQAAIEPIFDELRAKHPLVTDFQAECVRLMVHAGWNAIQIAKHLQVDSQKVRYHQEKTHVSAFRQELAMNALGWDAVLAQHTLVKLLHSNNQYVRLDAAKDLVQRAGLSQPTQRSGAVAVQLNFGVNTPLAQPAQSASAEPATTTADQEGGMGPAHNR